MKDLFLLNGKVVTVDGQRGKSLEKCEDSQNI